MSIVTIAAAGAVVVLIGSLAFIVYRLLVDGRRRADRLENAFYRARKTRLRGMPQATRPSSIL